MISLAHAQTAGASADPTGGLMQLLPMILMFVVLWFLMVRPQMKKAKEHKALIAAIAKGDEVVTGGGLIGRVIKVSDGEVEIELSPTVKVKALKGTLTDVRTRGAPAAANDAKS